MISSKTIDLLRTFSDKEFREFGLFVRSPFFNREKVVVKFYDVSKKYHPAFNGRAFEKEKIFKKLYPGDRYNDALMRNILSRTFELAEIFLSVVNFQSSGIDHNFSLLNELSSRKQEKLFKKEFEKISAIINENKIHNEKYFDNKYTLELIQRDFKQKQKSALNLVDDNLIKMTDYQRISFLMHKLKTKMFLDNMSSNMFGYDKQIEESDDHLQKESEKYNDIAYVRYYFNSYMLVRTEDEQYFYALKDIIKNNYEELSNADKKDIFSVLTNYCYVKSNKGELKFAGEHFDLLKQNVEKGHYKGGQQFMSHIFFLNVVITGFEAGEADWVERFIVNHSNELDGKNLNNTVLFCKALSGYHKKDYYKALEEASKVKTDDLSYKHQLKSLYLKIYFDMNNHEPFYSHVDSYKHFITNDIYVTSANKEVISSYINFTKKLFDIKNNLEEKDFDFVKLKKEVIENKSMINKAWLLQKIEEIEK